MISFAYFHRSLSESCFRFENTRKLRKDIVNEKSESLIEGPCLFSDLNTILNATTLKDIETFLGPNLRERERKKEWKKNQNPKELYFCKTKKTKSVRIWFVER